MALLDDEKSGGAHAVPAVRVGRRGAKKPKPISNRLRARIAARKKQQ